MISYVINDWSRGIHTYIIHDMTITTKQPLPQFPFSFIQFLSSSASPSYSYSLESSTTNFLGHQFLYSMETLASSASIAPVKVFSPRFKHKRLTRFTISSKSNGNESDMRSDPNDASIVPMSTYRPFSKDDAMGLVLSAANVRGWTTGSGMEGPSVPAGGSGDNESNTENISTFPWSLFTKSPRRRMRVAFTCNVCGQRTTRAINPHAYTDGTVFVQCCGCNVFHKLVDNLNLFHEMKCYVNPSFTYHDPNENVGSLGFKYLDMNDEEEDDDNMFPIL